MRVNVEVDGVSPFIEVRVGNVYSVRGGRALSQGHMMIVIAITSEKICQGRSVLMLVVDREGNPTNVTKYALHYVQDLTPIAFVDSLDTLELTMRPL